MEPATGAEEGGNSKHGAVKGDGAELDEIIDGRSKGKEGRGKGRSGG